MKYYSIQRKDKLLHIATTWMEMENIMLSVSERKRQISDDNAHMLNIKKQRKGLD